MIRHDKHHRPFAKSAAGKHRRHARRAAIARKAMFLAVN